MKRETNGLCVFFLKDERDEETNKTTESREVCAVVALVLALT